METLTLHGHEMKFRIARKFTSCQNKFTINGVEVEKDSTIMNAKDGTEVTIHDEKTTLPI